MSTLATAVVLLPAEAPCVRSAPSDDERTSDEIAEGLVCTAVVADLVRPAFVWAVVI